MNLKEAALYLRMPPHTVLKCVQYAPRPNKGAKLQCQDIKGEPHFCQEHLEIFLADLKLHWADNPTDPRPDIPTYFKEALRLEVGLKCGLCGSPYATDFAHIEPWVECRHNHPWNLICLCTKCHIGYDREKRITRAEVQRAKDRAQAVFLEELKYTVSGEKCLHWLKGVNIPLGGAVATGIDLLVAILDPTDKLLRVNKARVLKMAAMLDPVGESGRSMSEVLRLTEITAAHLSQSKLCEPFWEDFSDELYTKNWFPDIPIKLNDAGWDMVEHLRSHSADFFDATKYAAIANVAAREAIDSLLRIYDAHEDWYRNKDLMCNFYANESALF